MPDRLPDPFAAPAPDPEAAPAAFEPSARTRLDSVQVLRAVAALLVVAYHLPLVRHGEEGVDLFFAISGFIMVYVTERSTEAFFAKRLVRVVPLYWIGTLAVFAVALVAPRLLNSTSASLPNLFRSLLFIPYKDGPLYKPVLFVGWTLNLEMAFYVVFAVALRISHRYRALLGGGFLVLLFAVREVLHPTEGLFSFYSQPRMVEFAFGMAAYYAVGWLHRNAAFGRNVALRVAFCVAGGVIIAAIGVRELPVDDLPILGYGAGMALAFTLVVAGCQTVRFPRALTIVGDASYSLYLFHAYVVLLLARVFHVFDRASAVGYAASVLCVGVVILVAVGIFERLEKPLTETLRKRLL